MNFYTPHNTAYVTAKMRCGVIMVLAKLYTASHHRCDYKNEVRCSYSFG